MGTRRWIDATPGPAPGGRRAGVLELLRTAGAAMGVDEVAKRAGLHPNTARFHLEGLARAGLVERRPEDRSQPGRPRVIYRVAPGQAAAGGRSYHLLAEMLAGLVARTLPDPAGAAREAGQAWGRYLTRRPPPFQHVDADEATRRLIGVLAEIGFVADAGNAPGVPRLLLRHCPFREVAEHGRDVVCSLHLGLMQGVLAELGAPLAVSRLEPLVEPYLCLAHLTGDEPPPTPAEATSR